MLEDVLIKNTWQELKQAGATSETKTERVATGYRNEEYEEVKIKDLTFEIRHDEFSDEQYEWLEEDSETFLVNYHRDFEVKRDDIITKDEVAELYRGEKSWTKTEKEKGYWIFELTCLIHSGVWLSFENEDLLGNYYYGFDTSRAGLVLVSKKVAKTREQAKKRGRAFIDTWNKLLSGEVYAVFVKKNGKDIDSICGIVGLDKTYNWILNYIKS